MHVAQNAQGTRTAVDRCPAIHLPHNYEPGDHLCRRTNQQLVTMKFSMLAIAATAFAGVQGFAPVANPSARVMAMQVRRFPIGCFGWLIECSLQMKNGNA